MRKSPELGPLLDDTKIQDTLVDVMDKVDAGLSISINNDLNAEHMTRARCNMRTFSLPISGFGQGLHLAFAVRKCVAASLT